MAHKYVPKLAELKVKVYSYHILVCHHVGTTLLVKMSTQESSFNKYWIWTFKKALIACSALDENVLKQLFITSVFCYKIAP